MARGISGGRPTRLSWSTDTYRLHTPLSEAPATGRAYSAS